MKNGGQFPLADALVSAEQRKSESLTVLDAPLSRISDPWRDD